MSDPQDIVADMPIPISAYLKSGGSEDNFKIKKGFIASLNNKEFFIHCGATLPINDFKSDLGFGLWVKVERNDFERYLKAQENDHAYLKFSCKGTLANTWPLFPGTYTHPVQIRVIDKDQKPFIVDVESSDVELAKYKEVSSLNQYQKGILRKRIKEFYIK